MDNTELLKQAENFLGKPLKCSIPFEYLMFFAEGEVFPCCSTFVNNYKLGNIFEDDFEQIWNGDKAKEFRQSIIDGNFKFCDLSKCLFLSGLQSSSKFNFDYSIIKGNTATLPKHVEFNIDKTCNVKCIMCRDEHIVLSDEIKNYNEIVDSKLIPLLENAETLYLNGSGEIFVSNLCKSIIKKATEKYPNLKFKLISNGILATEENIRELGLLGRIKSFEISIHAATKETYDKIVKNGNFEKVMENLKNLVKLQDKGLIEFIQITFVVSSYNYKEMIDFQNLANKLNVQANFWEYRKWGAASLDKRYEDVAVFEPYHPEHDQFLEIVKNEIFSSSNCNIHNKLRPIG